VCFTKYYKDDPVREDEMDVACSMHAMRNAYKILLGKPNGKA
jgi:hypothetical protein